ncbi:unnamed protein product [Caenorhabditis angaria]|uniref:Uncharacterized protein n=1 Tax=Caenorhabditis angaria TaxID=860376 RepID=A0A9P1N4P2_9PELO|nr:unnamed protein product [Caenorhabditis angaria]
MNTIRSNSILIIMIFLINITHSAAAADSKQCTPKNADEQYEDVTFVFVINHYIDSDGKDQIFHVLSQITCEIPIADNIKGYVMYYGAKKLPVVEDEDFVSSKGLLKKLQSVHDITDGNGVGCNDFKSKFRHFADSEKFKNRKNIYYIAVYTGNCAEVGYPLERLHILYRSYTNSVLTIKSSFGQFNVKSNLNIDLVDVRTIYKRIVQEGLRVVPKDTSWLGYLIGGIIGLLVGGALGIELSCNQPLLID